MWLLNPYRFGTALDADAAAYIAAVEAADGQALEAGVRTAINAFVVDCKADGIWNAIKASCILAGARTLNGALVPLVGTAPTNFNFVAGDYNRKTGLVGNGSTKYLNSNRNNNADPQNSNHNSFFLTSLPIGAHRTMGAGVTGGNVLNGANLISGTSSGIIFRNRSSTAYDPSLSATNNSFAGMSRSSSSSFNVRCASTNQTASIVSNPPSSISLNMFRDDAIFSNARLAFYSIGESLNLALLDARVTTLINAFAAAIP